MPMIYAARARFKHEYHNGFTDRGITQVALYKTRPDAAAFVQRATTDKSYTPMTVGRTFLTSVCARGFKRAFGFLPKPNTIYEITLGVEEVGA